MNKKGFTLVELLAVIAILAILVIIALPNVLKMYNDARKNSFVNEVNSIIKVTRQQYLLAGGDKNIWTNADGAIDEPKLSLNGGHDIKYYVKSDSNGNIVKLQVTNGTYQYSKNGIIDNAKIEDVKTVSELEKDEILVINPSGINGTLTEQYINLFGTYDTYQEAVSTSGKNFFIKEKVLITDVWNIICMQGELCPKKDEFFESKSECNDALNNGEYASGAYCERVDYNSPIQILVGFIYNNNVNYLVGGNGEESFQANKVTLGNVFDASMCNGNGYYYSCTTPEFKITVNRDGVAEVDGQGMVCSFGRGCDVPVEAMAPEF